jgi:serine/threonine protein kinase
MTKVKLDGDDYNLTDITYYNYGYNYLINGAQFNTLSSGSQGDVYKYTHGGKHFVMKIDKADNELNSIERDIKSYKRLDTLTGDDKSYFPKLYSHGIIKEVSNGGSRKRTKRKRKRKRKRTKRKRKRTNKGGADQTRTFGFSPAPAKFFEYSNFLDEEDERDKYFIIIEFINGITLKESIKQVSVRNYSYIIDVITKIVSIMKILHDNKLYHLDFKEDNIMVKPDGSYIFIDLSCIDQIAACPAEMLHKYPLLQTCYNAHDNVQLECKKKADMWSIGIILFYLITGKYLHDNDVSYVNPVSNDPAPNDSGVDTYPLNKDRRQKHGSQYRLKFYEETLINLIKARTIPFWDSTGSSTIPGIIPSIKFDPVISIETEKQHLISLLNVCLVPVKVPNNDNIYILLKLN